ncbi:AAA family ATPase [Helicobacter turcicus]|uniref:ATP-binding protein n=1 Tax=Helicobacter turcicus TaxID=2867412 RepID=A0ABS7JPH0_9HELI|nr:ATP-binding protein [Helicobacter turcicus]MBX7491269.1 ATP-binding protein [Helicobacter turcicus]MBX7546092.1 ATP-binding protein [Helicobacter turcicus]
MLKKFGISGLYSFGNTLQEINFTAKPKSKLKNTKYEFNFDLSQNSKPMKSAIFFGQNATGKTNLFLGIKNLLNIIKYGFNYTKRYDIPNSAFNKNSKEITLELELSDNHNASFKYSIVFDKESIKKENFTKNNKTIFSFDDGKASFSVKKSESEMLSNFFSRKLSDNILYTIKDLELNEVEDFIALINNILIYMSSTYSKSYVLDFQEFKKDYFLKNKSKALNIFKIIDDSINDFDFESIETDEDKEEKNYKIVFVRKNQKYNYQEESDGLKKIIQLMDCLLEIMKSGKIIIVDELDSSISTKALIKIFNELVNSDENKNGQLIVSSHNVLLFDVSFLNSQQIFLIQKNENLETIIKNYYEYDIRSEKKRAYIDYLKGYYDE